MTARKIPHILLVFACLALIAGGCRSVSVPPSVTGRAIYMLNLALPADAIVEFKLVQTTADGEILSVVSEQSITNARRAPIAFDLPYSRSEIKSKEHYGVTCEIRSGERVLFRTARPFPVLTHGSSKQVEILLERVL